MDPTGPVTAHDNGSHHHEDKKAKTSSSSSTTTHTNSPPSPVPRLHFQSLPELAHDAIASFLPRNDLLSMIESGRWLLEAYGRRVALNVPLRCQADMIINLLRHRPGMVGLKLTGSYGDLSDKGQELQSALRRFKGGQEGRHASIMDFVKGLVEATKAGYCDKLKAIDIANVGTLTEHPGLPLFFQALADGMWPQLEELSLTVLPVAARPPSSSSSSSSSSTTVIKDPMLGDALRSRMEKGGCCGLKALKLAWVPTLLSSAEVDTEVRAVLSSGACELLERLEVYEEEESIGTIVGATGERWGEWITRTRCPRLKVLEGVLLSESATKALCSTGVAPHLEHLGLGEYDNPPSVISELSKALGRGAWKQLKELAVSPTEGCDVDGLVEAIRVGVPLLKELRMSHMVTEGVVGLARALAEGACARMIDLDLEDASIGDGGARELARALAGGAPCSNTLKSLILINGGIGPQGMKDLADAFSGGACPKLEDLYLSCNDLKDEGVLHLAQCIEGGALRGLLELNLEMVEMGDVGARALSRALLMDNAFTKLEYLNVAVNEVAGTIMRELVDGLNSKRGPGKVKVSFDINDYSVYSDDDDDDNIDDDDEWDSEEDEDEEEGSDDDDADDEEDDDFEKEDDDDADDDFDEDDDDDE